MSPDVEAAEFRAPPQLQIDYARELNPQQYEAVTAPPGPSLVIAGAGSGKTRTLTYRVAYLLEQGIPPERILLLTFTNKAAREMMRRVVDLLGQKLETLWGGTFHAIGNRVLRQHANLLGYERDFSILDREDARHFITECVEKSGINTEELNLPKGDELGEIFSLAVNKNETVSRVLQESYRDLTMLADPITAVQRLYTERKLAGNAMDFDDLLVLWLKLLEEHPDVREHYQRRFQFILVDEYQDTNLLQSKLIDLLAARHHNLMVVGDDAQSIYAWRGANFLNILEFPKRYPEAKTYKIETNYRSTPEILRVANAAIDANVHQFTKELAAARKSGNKPVVAICRDAGQQSAMVAHQALHLREEGCSLDRMAVLYRSHFHAFELQLELARRGIPFSITSGTRFYEQAHLKDAVAYLKFVLNPRDDLSFKRLVELLPGIGAKAAERLWQAFLNANPEPSANLPRTAVRLQACAGTVPKKAAVAWAQFVATMAQLDGPAVRGRPEAMLRLAVEAQYEELLKASYANYRSRLEDLEQLASFSQQFSSVEDFLTQLALLSNLEAEDDRPGAKAEERLRLSTIHQAKGLEFDVVFVIMLCDGLFPSSRSSETRAGEEEERRLLYVAITRARNALYLSYPLTRASYGGGGSQHLEPSRFLREIPLDLVEEWNLRPYA